MRGTRAFLAHLSSQTRPDNIQDEPIEPIDFSFLKFSKKLLNKVTSAPHTISSRSSIQMLPIISGLVEKQNPEIEYGTLQEGSLSSTNFVDKCCNQKEDLYFWMAKQQENKQKKDPQPDKVTMRNGETRPPTSYSNKGILQDSIKLLDTYLIFELILTCLGVMPQQ